MQLKVAAKFLAATILAGGMVVANARSLSYRMRASEGKACFYAVIEPNVNLASALLQFYFASSDAKGTEVVYVDSVVTGPLGQQLHNQQRQTHAEINLKPSQAGEYALCLTHSGSPTDKNIDLDITLPTPPMEVKEETGKLQNTVPKLQRELSDLVHTLRYIKNRERRNLETVESVENWIFYISIFEVLLIIGMSILQVTVLRMFFSGSSKQRV